MRGLALAVILLVFVSVALPRLTVAATSSGYAEWMPKLDSTASIEAGQVVGVFGNSLSLSTAGADRVLVVATEPLVAASDPGDAERKGFAPVALVGQALIRVRGLVETGDLLFASGRNDGTAIVVSAEQVTVRDLARFLGQALESFQNNSTRPVRSIVTAIATEPFATLLAQRDALLEAHEDEIEELREKLTELDRLESEVKRLSEAMARLELLEANRAGEELAPLPRQDRRPPR